MLFNLTSRFSMFSTGLDSELLTVSSGFINRFLHPALEVSMDRGAHKRFEIGGAGVDVFIVFRANKVPATFRFTKAKEMPFI